MLTDEWLWRTKNTFLELVSDASENVPQSPLALSDPGVRSNSSICFSPEGAERKLNAPTTGLESRHVDESTLLASVSQWPELKEGCHGGDVGPEQAEGQDGGVSTLLAVGSKQPQLEEVYPSGDWVWRLKNTFLEVVSKATRSAPQSPRALSDPGVRDECFMSFAREGAERNPSTPTASGGDMGPEQTESLDAEDMSSRSEAREPAGPGDSTTGTASPARGQRATSTGTRPPAPSAAPSGFASERPALEEGWQGDGVGAPPRSEACGPAGPGASATSAATLANQIVAQWLICIKACEHSPHVDAGDELGSLPSVGSVGHSLRLCNYPCKEMLIHGHCEMGARCGYCHLPHDRRRPVHLDKRNRMQFELLSDEDRFRMVWPILQYKVQEFGIGNRASQLLQEWGRDLEGSFMQLPEQRAAWSAGQRRLSKCLRTLSLTELGLIFRPGESQGGLGVSIEVLLGRLRVLALASGR